MLREFLRLSDQQKAIIAAWMYHRYIVRPYIKEQARHYERIAGLIGNKTVIVEDNPRLH